MSTLEHSYIDNVTHFAGPLTDKPASAPVQRGDVDAWCDHFGAAHGHWPRPHELAAAWPDFAIPNDTMPVDTPAPPQPPQPPQPPAPLPDDALAMVAAALRQYSTNDPLLQRVKKLLETGHPARALKLLKGIV